MKPCEQQWLSDTTLLDQKVSAACGFASLPPDQIVANIVVVNQIVQEHRLNPMTMSAEIAEFDIPITASS